MNVEQVLLEIRTLVEKTPMQEFLTHNKLLVKIHDWLQDSEVNYIKVDADERTQEQ